MSLFSKICLIARVLRIFHIPLEGGLIINVYFKIYVQGECCKKMKDKVFGKGQDYNMQRCHVKKNVNKIK